MKLILFAVVVVVLSMVLAVFFPEYLKYLGIVILFILLAKKNAVERVYDHSKSMAVGLFWNVGTFLCSVALTGYVGWDFGFSARGIVGIVLLGVVAFILAVEKMEER